MKTTYSIDRESLIKLQKARELQVARARTTHRENEGEEIHKEHPAAIKDWANVSLVNGSTLETALPVGPAGNWAKSFPEGAVFDVAIEGTRLDLSYAWPGTSRRSELSLRIHPAEAPVETRCGRQWLGKTPRMFLGEAIPVVAPAEGGAFNISFGDGEAAELKQSRKANAMGKKLAAWQRQLATARAEERKAREALIEAARLQVENAEFLREHPMPWAIARARATRAARLEMKRVMDNPKAAPVWLPDARDEERPRQMFNALEGNLLVAETKLAQYEPPMRWDGNTLYWARKMGMTPEAYAKKQAANFNVPITSMKMTIYGPKHTALETDVKLAGNRLADFIRDECREELKRRGLPAACAHQFKTGIGWFRGYSARRLAMRQWADKKTVLSARYLAARNNTLHVLSLKPGQA